MYGIYPRLYVCTFVRLPRTVLSRTKFQLQNQHSEMGPAGKVAHTHRCAYKPLAHTGDTCT